MVCLGGLADDHGLAGAGGSTAHAVDLFAIWIGAADHTQQQRIARRTRHLSALG
ncbi:hypothetical protein D9M71_849060 [compost metagenome]